MRDAVPLNAIQHLFKVEPLTNYQCRLQNSASSLPASQLSQVPTHPSEKVEMHHYDKAVYVCRQDIGGRFSSSADRLTVKWKH